MMIDTNIYCLKCFLAFLGIFVFVGIGRSQNEIIVKKIQCEKQSGYSLEIRVFYDFGKYKSSQFEKQSEYTRQIRDLYRSGNYKFSNENRFTTFIPDANKSFDKYTIPRDFNTLTDSIKLEIVKQLLYFESDTSLCCYDVQQLPFDGNDGRCGCPMNKKYSVQIDALFIISAICFDRCRSYACVPMIMDTLTRKCVNEDQVAIKEVYQKYREWYNDCLKKGKIGRYFPFNDGRYVWKNGRRGYLEDKE